MTRPFIKTPGVSSDNDGLALSVLATNLRSNRIRTLIVQMYENDARLPQQDAFSGRVRRLEGSAKISRFAFVLCKARKRSVPYQGVSIMPTIWRASWSVVSCVAVASD